MKMSRTIVLTCILLSAFLHRHTLVQANPLDIVDNALNFITSLQNNEQKVVDLYLHPEKFRRKYNSEADKAVFNELRDLTSEEIESLTKDFRIFFRSVKDADIQKTLKYLFHDLKSLENKFKRFLDHAKNKDSYDELENFTVDAIIAVIHTDAFNSQLVDELSISIRSLSYTLTCEKKQNLQQIFIGYYKTLLKATLMELAAYTFAKDALSDTWDFSALYSDPVGNAAKGISQNSATLRNSLKNLKRKLWQCDPIRHVKDVTYSNVQPVFQKFIQYEGDIKEESPPRYSPLDYRFEACKKPHCAQYNDGEKHYVECRENSGSKYCDILPTKKRCTGYFKDCDQLLNENVHAAATVCIAPAESEKRINGLLTSNNDMYGSLSGSACHNNQLYSLSTGVYDVFLIGESKYCAHCACTCVVDDADMDRYFGIEPVLADRLANMAVTGVRFVKIGHVFYIQVKQGELKAHGAIDADTNEWKNVETKFDDELFTMKVSGYQQSPNDPFSVTNLTTYYSNSYVYPITYDQRTVYLDDLEPITDKSTVLTGLKLAPTKDALRLYVHVTPFDYDTGKLVGQGTWYPDLNHGDAERTEVKLNEPEVPTKIRYHHELNSLTNQYIKFQLSDVKKDFGQTIVPFLDTQNVETNPPVPLAGAGLIHKGHNGSGGFLGFTLTQYDFSKHR